MATEDRHPELDVDYITVPGQLYAVLSLVGPTGTNQRNDKFGLKIRGCFATVEEAGAHIKRLQQADPTMDIFVADMYKWLLIPPDVNAIDSQEYQEDFLNNLIKGYRENQMAAKQHFHERKEAVKKDGLDKHLLEHEKLAAPADDATAADKPDAAMFEAADPLQALKEASGSDGSGASGSGST
jgi:hypothetical protein